MLMFLFDSSIFGVICEVTFLFIVYLLSLYFIFISLIFKTLSLNCYIYFSYFS